MILRILFFIKRHLYNLLQSTPFHCFIWAIRLEFMDLAEVQEWDQAVLMLRPLHLQQHPKSLSISQSSPTNC